MKEKKKEELKYWIAINKCSCEAMTIRSGGARKFLKPGQNINFK
jgi:hypothetical protein